MEQNERQQLLDRLGGVLGQTIAAGLADSPDSVKRSVLTGLQNGRILITAQIAFGNGALSVAFGVVDVATGLEQVKLFEIASPVRPVVVQQLGPESEIVN